APYSNYRVGAAVRGDNGKIYRGANVENASYGLSICAERNAISAAALDGVRRIVAAAVVTASSPPVAPCGACRQTLAEFADDLPLLEWLRGRVWPYEAALDEKSMRACVRLAAAELLLGGTTAILDMGTVHEQDALADEVAQSGLRALLGKAMMDLGEGVPAR